MKWTLCIVLLLTLFCQSKSQDKLNILYPLTDFPGANIIHLLPTANNTYIIPILYRENNTLSSSAYFSFDTSYIKTSKILGFSNSIDGLSFANNDFVSFGKNRSDPTLLQIRTYDDQLNLISTDSIFDDSDSTFPTNSKYGLNHHLFAYISDYQENDVRQSTLLFKNRNGDFLYRVFNEELKDSYITDIEISNDKNLLLSSSIIYPNNNGPYGQIIKSDTLGGVLWKFNGTEEFWNGAIVPYIAQLTNNHILQLYEIEGDQAPHSRLVWIDENGKFIKDKIIDVPGLDELYYYEVVPGKGDYFFAHGLYKFDEDDSYHAFLSKFDNDGNLIWNRYYQHEAFSDKEEFHSIEDIHELEDGRIVILAGANEWFNPKNIWLFEVDAEGCDDFQLITNTNDLAQNDPDKVLLYPNPTQDYVYLPSHFTGKLSIFDLNGRSVFSTKVKGPNDRIIDVHHIEPGLYICRMLFDNGSVLDKKLLIR